MVMVCMFSNWTEVFPCNPFKKRKKKIPTWESPLYFIVMERPILLIGYNFSIDYLTSSSLATLLLCFLCSILQFSQMH